MSNIRKIFTKREYDILKDIKEKIDEGIVDDATINDKGIIIPGIGLTIAPDSPGVLDVSLGDGFDDQGTQGDISLAKATTERLGGIIVGEGLSVDGSGVISIDQQWLTTFVNGLLEESE